MDPFTTSAAIPVFNCHVYLRRPTAENGLFQARCASASEVTSSGATERECLQSMVIRFKYFVQEHRAQGQPIPWVEPELPREADEVERWISVHL